VSAEASRPKCDKKIVNFCTGGWAENLLQWISFKKWAHKSDIKKIKVSCSRSMPPDDVTFAVSRYFQFSRIRLDKEFVKALAEAWAGNLGQ
jgi:hypothetical protein